MEPDHPVLKTHMSAVRVLDMEDPLEDPQSLADVHGLVFQAVCLRKSLEACVAVSAEGGVCVNTTAKDFFDILE